MSFIKLLFFFIQNLQKFFLSIIVFHKNFFFVLTFYDYKNAVSANSLTVLVNVISLVSTIKQGHLVI